MRTRNSDKTPPGRKAAVKSTTPELAPESTPPKTPGTNRTAKGKKAKDEESTPSAATRASGSKPEQPTVEDVNLVAGDTKLVPRTRKVVKKIVKRVVKKTTKTPVAAEVPSVQNPQTEDVGESKAEAEGSLKEEIENAKETDASMRIPKTEDPEKSKAEESSRVEDVKELGTVEMEESVAKDIVQSVREAETHPEEDTGSKEESDPQEETVPKEESDPEEETFVNINVVESATEQNIAIDLKEPIEHAEDENQFTAQVVGDSLQKNIMAMEVDAPPSELEKRGEAKVEMKEAEVEKKNVDDEGDPTTKNANVEGDLKDVVQGEDVNPAQDVYGADEGYEEYGDRLDLEDHGDDDYVEDDPEEPIDEEAKALEEEQRELTAVANERKIKKEYEIFVGGLDRDATEEEVRKVFETVGEVVEVRLHRNFSTNRNKGYAFVKFAKKEHAKRALSEMKNPTIHGKRCGTSPSEDNDTLFLGNICNTWTKEAIRQKLKDYGVERIENIVVVPDAQHQGRSRGFAFLEFSCHADASLAYKRLQKPDAIFGHPERTAKVAFAEPLREPDPEVMAQVKTVFLDGVPPHWDEEHVRKYIEAYGHTVRIVLARNMSTAKRKDFGFAHFSTHEAAVACIEGLNNSEMGDGNSKVRVRARLSNPLPKTQPVKGGMSGGFRIGHASSGAFQRYGRGFGRGGHHPNWPNFNRGRGPYQRGRGTSGRMNPSEHDFHNHHAIPYGRQTIPRGGRRAPLRGGYHQGGRAIASPGPSRSNFNRPWLEAPERGYGGHVSSSRQPFPPEEAFDRPFGGRHFEDPYFYDDGAHGMKRPRPLYMTDRDPDFAEPSRVRPRFNYAEPEASFRGPLYHDTYRPGSDPYARDYYGPDYGPYPSYYRGDHSYGGGYYY